MPQQNAIRHWATLTEDWNLGGSVHRKGQRLFTDYWPPYRAGLGQIWMNDGESHPGPPGTGSGQYFSPWALQWDDRSLETSANNPEARQQAVTPDPTRPLPWILLRDTKFGSVTIPEGTRLFSDQVGFFVRALPSSSKYEINLRISDKLEGWFHSRHVEPEGHNCSPGDEAVNRLLSGSAGHAVLARCDII